MTPRTVLVTGAGGALGSAVVPALRERGWTVRALVHRRPVSEVDEQVAEVGDGVAGADAVVHAAGATHARRRAVYRAANVALTETVLAAARDAAVGRFLHISTHALGEGGGAYADTKREAETLVRAAGIPFVIVRLPEVYGAGSAEGIDRLIAQARAGRPILVAGRGDAEVRPVHVDDVVPALVRALEAPEAVGRTYTLAGERLTMRRAAELTRDALGSSSPIVAVPRPAIRVALALARVLPLPFAPDQLDRLDARRDEPSPEASDDLNFSARPFADGVRSL